MRPAVIPGRYGVARCPDCFEVLKDEHDAELTLEDFERPTKRNRRCPFCGAILWQASAKLRRFAPAELVKKKLKGFFRYLIADEVHELKSEAAQGQAFGALAESIPYVVAMTGTLLGGYASDACRLFWRLDPRGMREEEKLRWEDLQAWIARYGVLERVVKTGDATLNRASRGKQAREYVRERPGLSPELFSRRMMERTVFLALDDLRTDLPPYREEVELAPMTPEQEEGYRKLEGSFNPRDRKQLGAMLQALLAYPDAPWDDRPLTVGDPPKVIRPERLPDEVRYPKEEALVRALTEEKLRGRRVAVYCTFTGKRDLLPRLERVLREHGLSVAVLRSSVPPEKREGWLGSHPADVLLCHPSLVETGLDLYQFPTIIWYSTGYKLATLRQASRRSWRIGQTKPVLVRFLAYEGTLQEAAIRLMGTKLRAATSMEGKFSVEGLQAMAEGTDLAGELARTLLEGMSSIPTVEELWHQASLELAEEPAAEPAQPKLIVLTERKGRGKRTAMAGQVALFEV